MNELWEKLDPGFFEPVWLLVGLVAVVALVLLEIGAHRRRQQALRAFVAHHLMSELTAGVSGARRMWKRVLLAGAVACLFVALARPHLFFQWQEEFRSGIDLLVAVDCSKSMLTEDVKPNRLERAKLAISDLADQLPDDRLGLIAFAGDAFLQVPLTLDHEAFQDGVRGLDTDTIPRPGTDVGIAIDTAVLALKSQTENTKLLILVTDGEDLEGHALAAAQNAAKAGLKIYTVGVGTPEGDLIPQRDDSGALMYLHDSDGQIVKSRLDESMLRQIAQATGGAYAPMGQRGEGLQEIYNKYIATLPRHQVESRRHRIEFEQYEWPLGLSILLLAASMLIGERARPTGDEVVPPSPPRRRGLPTAPPLRAGATVGPAGVALAALLAMLLPVHASTTATAERDYKSGKFPEAEENYQKAAAGAPQRDDLKFNTGDAAYKAGEYSQSEDAFRKALESPDLSLQEGAYYNIGNAQYRQGEGTQKDDEKKTIKLWQDALKSYEAALKLHQSADTQHNYEFVKRKLEELKQQQQQNQQNQQNKSGQDQKDKSQGGSGQSQNNNRGQSQNPQNQDGSQNQKMGGNQDQSGQNSQQNGQGQNGENPDNAQAQQGQHTPQQMNGKNPMNGHSTSRTEDQVDPGEKSQKEAEALLDSLKDDEKHVTAQSLNNGNEPPPPPASGKDW